jgi:hypothetical protein
VEHADRSIGRTPLIHPLTMNKWLRIALLALAAWVVLSIVFKILNALLPLGVLAVILFLVYTALQRGGFGRGVR